MIVLITAIIQSVAGFGFSLLAVPLMVLFVDLRQAVIVATLLGTVSNFGQAWQLRHHQHKPIAYRFILASCIGAPFGFALFRFGNQSAMKVVLGVAVLFGVWMLARGRDLQNAHVSLDWQTQPSHFGNWRQLRAIYSDLHRTNAIRNCLLL